VISLLAHCGNLTEHKTALCVQNIDVSGTHAYRPAANTQSLTIKCPPNVSNNIFYAFLISLLFKDSNFSHFLAHQQTAILYHLHNHLGTASTRWQGNPRTSKEGAH
jgi:hypothetical protein